MSGQRFRRRWEVALVFAVSAVGLALNRPSSSRAWKRCSFDLLPAKLAATGVVFFWNYLARRILVFGALREGRP